MKYLKSQSYKFYLFLVAFLVVPLCAFADYGYFTMPVDPTSLSYSGSNTGINSLMDHTSPLGINDTGTLMTRYDGMTWTKNDTSTCTNGLNCYNGHEGIDFAVASGTPVYAAASGTVEQAQWENPNSTGTGFGRFVRIWHSQYGVSTLYAHLSANSSGALPFASVVRENFVSSQASSVIGYSGSTGKSSGPHLHFQTYDINGDVGTSTGEHLANSVDPFGWSGTGTDPWAAHDAPFGYMWASARPFATSSVYNYVTSSYIMTVSSTWKTNQIYIIQGSLIVSSTATLTIPAGVVVKFDATSTYMEVDGTLKVNGTAASPVYFTSIEDDTVGGDTNNDATATTPGSGNWRDIRFNAGSSSTINYATIRYGGAYFSEANPNLYLNDGKLTIKSSTIASSLDYGLYMASGTVSIANSTVSNNLGYGVRCSDGTGGNVTLTGNKFINNGGEAVYLDYGNGNSLNFSPPSNNTSSGNGENGYHIVGTLGASQTWTKDIPYDSAGITIPSTSTLTVSSGTIVKLGANLQSWATNLGIFNVQGASSSNVYFTSYKDDSVGGDTNGDGTSTTPAPGDWKQLENDSGTSTINYATIRYGGLGISINANLYANGGNFIVTNSTVSSSQFYGIYIASGTVNISTSTIAHNPADGIYNNTTVTSTAQYDYWNASSGPSGVATGTGDGVTSYVNYIPFATSAVP